MRGRRTVRLHAWRTSIGSAFRISFGFDGGHSTQALDLGGLGRISRSTIVPAATMTQSPTAMSGRQRVEARRRDRPSRRWRRPVDRRSTTGRGTRCTWLRSSTGRAGMRSRGHRPSRSSRQRRSARRPPRGWPTARAGRAAATARLNGAPRPNEQPPMTTTRPQNGRPRMKSASADDLGKGECVRRARARPSVAPDQAGQRQLQDPCPARMPVAASTMTTRAPAGTASRSSMSSWPTAWTRTSSAGLLADQRGGGDRRAVVPAVGRPAHEDLDRDGTCPARARRTPVGRLVTGPSSTVQVEEVGRAADARVVAPDQLLDPVGGLGSAAGRGPAVRRPRGRPRWRPGSGWSAARSGRARRAPLVELVGVEDHPARRLGRPGGAARARAATAAAGASGGW